MLCTSHLWKHGCLRLLPFPLFISFSGCPLRIRRYGGDVGKAGTNGSSLLCLLLHCFHLSPLQGLNLVALVFTHSGSVLKKEKKLPFVGEIPTVWRNSKDKESHAVVLTLCLRQVHWSHYCVGTITVQGNWLFSVRDTSSCSKSRALHPLDPGFTVGYLTENFVRMYPGFFLLSRTRLPTDTKPVFFPPFLL